jgi:glycosyltransferase involved in cell wall biosynthesis
MPKPRVLFVTPAASRSGAPMLLLHLARWMRSRGEHEMSAVLVSGGAMTAELAAEMPTVTFEPGGPQPSAPVRWLRRQPMVARRRLAARVARCRSVVGRWPPDLVFCNSAAGAAVLDALGPYPCPVVVGLHEMAYALGRSTEWVDGGAMPAMEHHRPHYIAGSGAVREQLLRRQGIAADRVTVVHDFITAADFPTPPLPPPTAPLLAAAGVPAGAAVVGAIATVEWRKGADLLVPLARLLPATDATGRPVHLVWVGGGLTPLDMVQLRFDVETAGLGDRVHLVGATQRTADWYPAFTAFAMLSREDPFPLVALEAAACGLPVVCFADAGGVPELVEADAGRIVPYLDLAAFASALMELLDDPALAARMGRRAAEKVRARHDVSVAAPQVMECIDRLIGTATQ